MNTTTIDSRDRGLLPSVCGKPIVSGVLLCFAVSGWAKCQLNPGYHPKNIEMNMGNVVIKDTLPVGTLLASKDFDIPVTPNNGDAEQFGQCDDAGGQAIGTIDQTFAIYDAAKKIYHTAVSGIGIRLLRHIGGSGDDTVYPHQITFRPNGRPAFLNPSYFRVELIKIGEISGGGALSTGSYTTYYLDGDGKGKPILTTKLGGSGIVIVTPACTLDSGSKKIQVALGDASLSDFSGVGSVTQPKAFNIRLNCVVKPHPQTIELKFDATSDPSGAAGVLQLTQEQNRAAGVGIRVLKQSGDPVSFGSAWSVGQSPTAGGVINIPMQAQYYQTVTKVTPGVANGTATFTIEYK